MKRHALLIALPVIGLLSACASAPPVPSAPAGHSADDPMFQFVGTWEGTLDGYNAPNFLDSAGYPLTYRIVIEDNGSASVYTLVKGKWKEAKHGFFRVAHFGSQAIVSSITSARDEDGTWVEGSTFTLVHHDTNTVVAYWLRTVNNLDLLPTADGFHFAWGYSGPMHRMQQSSK